MLRTKLVEKIRTHILCSTTFSEKSYLLRGNVEEFGTAGQATDYNIIRRMRISCWISKATRAQTEGHTLPRPPPTRARARAATHACTLKHAFRSIGNARKTANKETAYVRPSVQPLADKASVEFSWSSLCGFFRKHHRINTSFAKISSVTSFC